MKRILTTAFVFSVFFCGTIFATQEAAAQDMDISGFVTSPQGEGNVSISDRSFGYGVSTTFVYGKIHEMIQPIGTLQYHNHDRAGDKDIMLAGGLRLALHGCYIQGTVGLIEKRDAMSDGNIKAATSFGIGYVPSFIGVAGNYYVSHFGNHYGAGLVVRF